MAKDAYYFSHDSNARNDVRLIKLRRMGGLEGVGLYWCTIEMLREADNYELKTNTIEDICYEFRVDPGIFELLFICGLLTQKEDSFYSASLKNRMSKLDKIKELRAIAGQKGGISKANAKQLLSNKSKVKNSKENNSKNCLMKNSGISIADIKDAFLKTTDLKNADKQYYFNAALDWSDSGGNKRTDWIATIRGFARRDLKEGKMKLDNTSPREETYFY